MKTEWRHLKAARTRKKEKWWVCEIVRCIDLCVGWLVGRLYDLICSTKFDFQIHWLFAHSASALSVCEWIYYYVYILDAHRVLVAVFFFFILSLNLLAGEMVRVAFYCMYFEFFSLLYAYIAIVCSIFVQWLIAFIRVRVRVCIASAYRYD